MPGCLRWHAEADTPSRCAVADNAPGAAGQGTARSGGRVHVERIYLKDLSFESPMAPEVFGVPWRPTVQLDLNTAAKPMPNNRFEVVLTVTLRATLETPAAGTGETAAPPAGADEGASAEKDERVGLIIEVQQAGVFLVEGMDEGALRHVLAVACPDILFPYVREAVDNLAARGTLPPFMLTPVDFAAHYAEAMRRRSEEAQRLN